MSKKIFFKLNLKKKIVEINVSSRLLRIDKKEMSLNDIGEIILLDSPIVCENNFNSSNLNSAKEISISVLSDIIKIKTSDESWVYYRLIGDILFLSGSVELLVKLSPVSHNKDYEYIAIGTGYFLPYETLCNEIKCSGVNTETIIDSSLNILSDISVEYINSFVGGDCRELNKSMNSKYLELSTSYLDKFKSYKRYVIYQSGMDSCLLTAMAQATLNHTNGNDQVDKELIQMHCDISEGHPMGAYQFKITNKITQLFPLWRRMNLGNAVKDPLYHNKMDVRFLVPNGILSGYSTNCILDENLNLMTPEPTLVLSGDKTSLYQHFNGTIEYCISPFSNLVGAFRRFLFGKYFIKILYKLTFANNSIPERIAKVSYSLIAPSMNGSYTAKFPQLSRLFGSITEDKLYSFIYKMAEHYSRKASAVCPVVFHSIVRDQILYFSVLRNSDASLPVWARASMCGPKNINFCLDHHSMTFGEIFVPKYNIRKRLKLLGVDIDGVVKSVYVDKKLFMHFWTRVFFEFMETTPILNKIYKFMLAAKRKFHTL